MEFIFVEPDSEELPNEPLPLENANAFLQDLNGYLIENDEKKEYPFELIFEGDTLYKSSILLPINEEFTLQKMIELELRRINTQEALDFLEWLQPYFISRSDSKNKMKSKKINEASNALTDPIKKGLFFCFILFIGLGLILFLRPTEGHEAPDYSTLIQKKDYLSAGERYPKNRKKIEQAIYNSILDKRTDSKIEKLKEFNHKYPTTFGDFDSAIFEKDYPKAIKVYENDKNEFTNEKERMTLVGYSYLKNDQLAEAKKISHDLKSIELDKKIYHYESLCHSIEEKEKELKELEKGGSQNREKAEKIAEEKFDLKEQLVNL